jgi:hypothetical protein
LASNNIIFHQTTNKNGECEFRVKFGRNKSFVYRGHDQFYYLDLYDNKVGKTRFNGICLGLDELDFLISLRSNLDSLQSCFPPMVSIFNCNLENQQCECIIMLSHFHLHISLFTTIQHQPYRIENYNQRVDEEEPTKKKVKYENVSPAEVEHIPQDILNDFFFPMN